MLLHLQKHKLPANAQQIFKKMLADTQGSVDRIFAKILIAQWLFGIGCAWLISPLSWTGATSSVHIHVWSAIFLGGAILGVPLYLVRIAPGHLSTRLAVSAGQLMFSALLIHLMGGRIEAHFHIFVSLALLAAYRDRTVFVPAVAITVVDHLVRGYLWPQSVFGVFSVASWRPIEHSAWVIFETISLCYLIGQNLSQFSTVAALQCSLQEKQLELESKVIERTRDLRDAKIFQESILNSIDAEICVLDESADILFVNERWRAFADHNGIETKSSGVGCNYIGCNYLEVCDRDQGPSSTHSQNIAEAIRHVRDGNLAAYINEYSCHNGNEKRWFHVRVNPVQLSNVRAIALVHIEVTETKRAQAKAESLAKLVLDSPGEVYILSKETLQFVEVNQGACKNLGYDRETLLTMSPIDLAPQFTQDELLGLLARVIHHERNGWSFSS